MVVCKLFSSRGKSFSLILVQFPHEPSATMFIPIKNLHISIIKYVQEKLNCFSNVGPKDSFILPHIYSLYYKARNSAISFTFNSLAVYCSSIVPRSIILIRSTNFHQNNTYYILTTYFIVTSPMGLFRNNYLNY